MPSYTLFVFFVVVAGIFGGVNYKRKWNEPSMSLSWFEGKGKIEKLLNNNLNFPFTVILLFNYVNL